MGGAVVFIYALVDPRDHRPRYVGKSNNPQLRLASLAYFAAGPPTKKQKWLTELNNTGLWPQLVILEPVLPSENWREREQSWIEILAHCDLVNGIPGKKRKPWRKR
jgi:hypothetical protein